MSAYLIGDVTVKDTAAYEQYRTEVGDLISRHHGKYIVRGGEIEVVKGDWRPNRLIILRFPDKASIRAYMNDLVFHELSELRQRAIDSPIVMVEEIDAEGASMDS